MRVTFPSWRKMFAFVSVIVAVTTFCQAQTSFPKKEHGQAERPVIIWAHYMPQVPHGNIHSHGHNGGNFDAWPLDSLGENRHEEYKEDIRQALASGINGFQMLVFGADEMCRAAREVFEETGEMFYVAPEWCWDLSPKNTDATIAKMAAFASAHQDDPHVYREKGRQVHFFYGGLRWTNHQAVLDFKQKLADTGADVLLIPTIYNFDRIALDRPDMSNKPGAPVLSGSVQWLKDTPLEGATDFGFGVDPAWGELLEQRLKGVVPNFFWVPSLGAGYDCSNRPVQAIHTPFNGMRNLWDTFQFWKKFGYRQYTYVTWNDCLESMLIPSSRNIWGYNTIMRYFHDVLKTGKGSFSAPQVVVSYPVDCLLGDQFFMQVLVLPAGDEKMDVRATVELKPVGGGRPVVLQSKGASSPESAPVFLEVRKETEGWISTEAVQPSVTVEIKSPATGKWEKLYDHVELGVTKISYNIVKFPVPYAVNLARVESKKALDFSLEKSISTIQKATVKVTASSPIRRLMLMEGTMSLGAFRNIGDQDKAEEENLYRDLFLRLEASEQLPVELTLKDGLIRDLYSPGDKVVSVNASSSSFSSFPQGGFITRVARVDLSSKGRISFSVAGKPDLGSLSVGLQDLEHGTVAKTIAVDGKKVTLSLTLTTDATDENIDYPLPPKGTFNRYLPLYELSTGGRVLQSMAWLQSGKVAYSNVCLARDKSPSAQEKVAVQWIDTKGTFDEFVEDKSSVSLNPFTPDMVKTSSLPKAQIPYFHLDFEEGAGARLNDHGTSQELGRAWFEYDAPKGVALARYEPEKSGRYQWVTGVRGKGIQLSENTSIRLRSKSSPVGAESISVWVHLSEAKGDDLTLWNTLAITPFKLKLLNGSTGSVSFDRAGKNVQTPAFEGLQPGWNHVVISYDLTSVSVYLNGKQVATEKSGSPVYQRTHNTPYFGFINKTRGSLGFDGQIDELEVIGTSLDVSEVSQLWQGKDWRDTK